MTHIIMAGAVFFNLDVLLFCSPNATPINSKQQLETSMTICLVSIDDYNITVIMNGCPECSN